MGMEVFKNDAQRQTWHLRFTDHAGFRRRLSARTRTRPVALETAHRIERLVDLRRQGAAPPPDLLQWIHSCPSLIRQRLAEWEILDPRTAQSGRRLTELLDLWETALLADGVTPDYARTCHQQVTLVCTYATPQWIYPCDLELDTTDQVVKFLRRTGPMPYKGRVDRRGLAASTCNDVVTRTKEFAAWLVTRGILPASPLVRLRGYSREVVQANRRRRRRPLSLQEQITLIQTTAGQPMRWRMTGLERARLYRVVLQTGLRASECAAAQVCWFDLTARRLTIPAWAAKARREDVLPIRPDLVNLLTEQFTGKHPQAQAWPALSVYSYAKMFDDDREAGRDRWITDAPDEEAKVQRLQSAFLSPLDHGGRVLDFYCLRHSYGTELARVELPAKHQRLMRHKDINTTMRYYTHLDQADDALGVDKLPRLPEPVSPIASVPSVAAG